MACFFIGFLNYQCEVRSRNTGGGSARVQAVVATNPTTRRTPSRIAASRRASAVSALMEQRTAQIYVTRTGPKYHTAGCRYLRRSQIGMSLKDAEAQGFGPCSVCRP